MDTDNHEVDDTPFADPQIKLDYEASLGRFLVNFNRIENGVSDLIAMALDKLGRQDLIHTANKGPLFARLANLELIMLALPTYDNPPYAGIRDLANKRNELAHGHFDQNPFDGSYQIIGKNGTTGKDWPPEMIAALIEDAETIADDVKECFVHFWFDDLDDLPHEENQSA